MCLCLGGRGRKIVRSNQPGLCVSGELSQAKQQYKIYFQNMASFLSFVWYFGCVTVDNGDTSFLEVVAWTVPYLSVVTKDH